MDAAPSAPNPATATSVDVPPGQQSNATTISVGTSGRQPAFNVGGRVRRFLRVPQVYRWCMTRTNIDLDDAAVASVMRQFDFTTKRDAVNYALRALVTEPLDTESALALEGSGWDADLDELRGTRA